MKSVSLLGLLLLLFCGQLTAQTVTISGQIFSEKSGEPIPNVSVIAKVSKQEFGTTSDIDGKYSLTIPKADKAGLRFVILGFVDLVADVSLKEKTSVEYNVRMTESSVEVIGTVIKATSGPQPGTEGQSIEIISQQQIDQQAATNLKAGLQMVTGVTILDNQINIRGSSGFNYGTGSRVLVLLNGMPAMNTERATVNFNLLPADNIERVEVLKGSAALRYGSSALGGVVNVMMEKPGVEPENTIRVAQRFFMPPDEKVENWEGVQRSYISSLHFGRSQRIREKWLFSSQVDLVRDAGFRNEEFNNRGRLLLLNEWQDAFKKDGLTLGLNVQYLGERSAVFVFWKGYPGKTHEPGLNSLSRQTIHYLIADPSVKYISPKGNVYHFQSRVNWQKTESSTGLSGSSLQNWNELTWKRRFTPWVSITTGANYQYSYSHPDNLEGQSSGHQSAVFAIAEFGFITSKWNASERRINIAAGGRFQYEQMFGDTLQTDSTYRPVGLVTMKHPLAGVTLNCQLWRFTYLRASLSQGVRAASMNERFANISLGGLQTNPAPNIDAETGYSTEIGITQYFGGKGKQSTVSGYVDVAVFLMRFQDMIEFLIDIPRSSLTKLSFKAQNLTDVRIRGIETNVGVKFEHKQFRLTFNGGVTLVEPVNLDGLKQLDGDSATVLVLNPPVTMGDPDFYKYIRDVPYTLKYRSKTTVTKSLTLGYGIVSLTANYRYISRMLNVDKLLLFAIPGSYAFRNDHLNGWHLLDFILAFNIKEKHTISAHLFNALNSEYMILPGNIGEQRSIAVQYKVVF